MSHEGACFVLYVRKR